MNNISKRRKSQVVFESIFRGVAFNAVVSEFLSGGVCIKTLLFVYKNIRNYFLRLSFKGFVTRDRVNKIRCFCLKK